jgi:iron-sulfur cluster repair protein YtfE (RIC family)
MDVIEHLEQEHRTAEELLARLKDTEPGRARDETLEELRHSLDTHMAVEERFIYPLVEEVFDEEEREGADTEHDLTRQGLRTLAELEDRPGFEAALDMLEAGLHHHVQEEEDEIFPKLRQDAAEQLAGMDPDELESAVTSGSDDGSPSGQEPTKDELYRAAREQDVAGRSTMSKAELAEAVEGPGSS